MAARQVQSHSSLSAARQSLLGRGIPAGVCVPVIRGRFGRPPRPQERVHRAAPARVQARQGKRLDVTAGIDEHRETGPVLAPGQQVDERIRIARGEGRLDVTERRRRQQPGLGRRALDGQS